MDIYKHSAWEVEGFGQKEIPNVRLAERAKSLVQTLANLRLDVNIGAVLLYFLPTQNWVSESRSFPLLDTLIASTFSVSVLSLLDTGPSVRGVLSCLVWHFPVVKDFLKDSEVK